jgi:hypothetical protein
MFIGGSLRLLRQGFSLPLAHPSRRANRGGGVTRHFPGAMAARRATNGIDVITRKQGHQ